MSWTDLSQEDAAEGDAASGTNGITLDTGDLAAAASDPDTAIPVDGLDPATALGVSAPSTPVAAVTAPVAAKTTVTATVPVPSSLLP
jgi:hypothetical protein